MYPVLTRAPNLAPLRLNENAAVEDNIVAVIIEVDIFILRYIRKSLYNELKIELLLFNLKYISLSATTTTRNPPISHHPTSNGRVDFRHVSGKIRAALHVCVVRALS